MILIQVMTFMFDCSIKYEIRHRTVARFQKSIVRELSRLVAEKGKSSRTKMFRERNGTYERLTIENADSVESRLCSWGERLGRAVELSQLRRRSQIR